jgi:hypothetical protein
MFSYAEAETILAVLHNVDRERQIGAFRARLKHLKKLGIPKGVRPGRGKRVLYSRNHLFQWVFCLECSQFAIDPTWMVDAIDKHWDAIYRYVFVRAETHDLSGDDDVFMCFSPSFMSYSWNVDVSTGPKIGVPIFISVDKKNLQEHIENIRGDSRRLSLLNVSEIIRTIRDAEQRLKGQVEEHAR